MRIDNVLAALRITGSTLLIVLAIPLGDTFQRLMNMNGRAEYAFEIPISSQMSNLGTFCLVSLLFIIAGWGVLTAILPEFGENALATRKELRIIVHIVALILLIGMAIVGNYFAQRIDRWSF